MKTSWTRGAVDPCGPMWTLTLLLVSACPLRCGASWMQLGLSPAGPPEVQDQDQDQAQAQDRDQDQDQAQFCAGLPLGAPQSLLLRLGARLAMKECRSQFRHERWNCSSTRGPEAPSGTKEAAFIQAMMAAALVHAVTRSCSHGNATRGAWRWGGGAEPLRHALRLSRQLTDDGAANGSTGAMTRHNSEAGRQAVVRTLVTRCRCHGVSGSCAVRSCWRTLAAPQQVGAHLKERYERGARLWEARKTRRKERRRAPADRLVFLHKSPNYCVADARRGVAGTAGRRCSRAAAGGAAGGGAAGGGAAGGGAAAGCALLCCGRGYDTRLVRRQRSCHCKFSWCCRVRCRRCESMDHLHRCK